MALSLPKQYSFLSRFYRLSVVSMLSNMMVPLAGLVDTAFLGHLADIRHLAGVILASILFDYLYRVLKFLRSSTTAITAQAAGKEDSQAILAAGLRSALVALAIGLGIVLLQYPIQTIGFAILSGASEVEGAGSEYFYGRIWGAPAVLLNFVLFGWFVGREKNGAVLLMSLVGNLSNVALDYLMIFKWGWNSAGAGIATATSQYLALIVGLIAAALTINWNDWKPAFKDVLDRAAFKETIALKGNILIRFLVLISTFAIFTNISSTMGTTILAQNGLLLQIAMLSQFTINGIGLTTQTLTGNFKSQGAISQLFPVLLVSVLTALPIAFGFAGATILFPDQVFGLLTNHADVSTSAMHYTLWLLPLLEVTAVAFVFEGYFIGLKAGATIRNAVLLAFGVAFMPLAGIAWYLQNNHLLWLAMISYVASLSLILGLQLPATFNPTPPESPTAKECAT